LADRLHSAAIQLLRRVRVRDGELGLSAPRLSALSVIVFAGPITISELAATQGVRPPTMTRLVDGLERDGLAMREAHPEDGRSVQVRATGMGRLALSRERQQRTGALSTRLAELSTRDRETLGRAVALMERVAHDTPRDRPA
jgi:DNA-binding MarR family transcriptional regulator